MSEIKKCYLEEERKQIKLDENIKNNIQRKKERKRKGIQRKKE